MRQHYTDQSWNRLSWYRVVYGSRLVALGVFVLLASFVLQPIHRAYADELEPDTTLPEPELVEEEVETEAVVEPEEASGTLEDEMNDELVSTNEPAADSTTNEADTESDNELDEETPSAEETAAETVVEDGVGTTTADTTTVLVTDDIATFTTPTVDTGTTTVLALPTDTGTSTATSTPTIPDEETVSTTTVPVATSTTSVATSTDSITSNDVESETDLAPVSEEIDNPGSGAEVVVSDKEVVEDTATSTATTTPQVATVTHNSEANEHQFSREDCVAAGSGTYYCTQSDDNEQPFVESGVFAAPDSGGDMEIYVWVDGESVQLTNDDYDDGSPHYDAVSERVVWHSLRGDRYQIVSYDFITEQERLLTDASYNNMEPVAFGEQIAWQAWRGGDWEIMFFDGETTIQVTSNAINDMAPSIYAGYVMWQAQFADGARIAVYDINTGTIDYITTSDDIVAAKNPPRGADV